MVDRHAVFEYTRGDGLGEGVRVSLRDIADTKRQVSAPARPRSVEYAVAG
jgi:hypothetical protein